MKHRHSDARMRGHRPRLGVQRSVDDLGDPMCGRVKQDGLLAAFEEGTPGHVSAPAAHLDGRLSWGMRLPGQGLYGPGERLSPYAEFSLVENGTRHLRTGLALEGPVGMGLALERRESPADAVEHGMRPVGL